MVYDETVSIDERGWFDDCSNPNCNGGEIAVPVEQDADSGEWHVEYDACPDCN
jgi:hypothetical protein